MRAERMTSELRHLELFADATPRECDRARSLLTGLTLSSGVVLWRAGSLGRDFAIVADGLVGVTGADGQPLAVLGPGQIVGELALLGASVRQATVTTLSPVELYVGGPREFATLLEAVPSAREKVVRAALTRVPA